jgi:hypothetical protein
MVSEHLHVHTSAVEREYSTSSFLGWNNYAVLVSMM